MSATSLLQLIRTRIKALVLDVRPQLPVQMDNWTEKSDKFTKPENSEWVRCNLRIYTSNQIDICRNPRTRTTGAIVFQVFGPFGMGDQKIMEIADFLKAQFRTTTDAGVVYREPTITTVGLSGGWWQVNVSCPFQWDEVVGA